MKSVFFTALFVFFIFKSYSQKTKDFDKYQILGTWKFVATRTSTNDSNKLTNLCSICPDINFNSARFAKVIFPAGEIQTFLFLIEKNKLKLITTVDNENPFFFDGEYLIDLKTNSEFLELELIQKKKSYSFLLTKKK